MFSEGKDIKSAPISVALLLQISHNQIVQGKYQSLPVCSTMFLNRRIVSCQIKDSELIQTIVPDKNRH